MFLIVKIIVEFEEKVDLRRRKNSVLLHKKRKTFFSRKKNYLFESEQEIKWDQGCAVKTNF